MNSLHAMSRSYGGERERKISGCFDDTANKIVEIARWRREMTV